MCHKESVLEWAILLNFLFETELKIQTLLLSSCLNQAKQKNGLGAFFKLVFFHFQSSCFLRNILWKNAALFYKNQY